MFKILAIDPGKFKCGLVLAEINEKKIYELKRQLDDLNYRETATYGQQQHIEKKFDKWYEENKLRLERND